MEKLRYLSNPSSKHIKNISSLVNVIYCDNNGGLTTDARIVTDTLKQLGFQVFHNGELYNSSSIMQKVLWRLRRFYLIKIKSSYIYDLNIHIERIHKYSIQRAKKNFFIPNLEWLSEECYHLMHRMDKFVCKTRHAQNFFKNNGLSDRAVYTSFTTYDCSSEGKYRQIPSTFVHISGKSDAKGTLALISAWTSHPEWPLLRVFTQSTNIGGLLNASDLKRFNAENVSITDDYLPLEQLKRVQNESEVHICLSEVEGFGHYICEPLSSGAIVLTTNAEPMNELVGDGRGALVNTVNSEPIGYATKYFFDLEDFENKLERLLSMSTEEKLKIKRNARDWYVANDIFFKKSFSDLLTLSLSR